MENIKEKLKDETCSFNFNVLYLAAVKNLYGKFMTSQYMLFNFHFAKGPYA